MEQDKYKIHEKLNEASVWPTNWTKKLDEVLVKLDSILSFFFQYQTKS